MRRHSLQFGFTLVELLIVITILAIVFTFLLTGFRDFARFQEYTQAVSDVTFQLQQAQTNARSAINDTAHGVHIDADSITLFSGTTYNTSDPNNEVITYDNVVFTTNLSGGSDTIVFTELTGLAQATGTVSITGTSHTATTQVTVTTAGIIE